jgi:hypothetical protein
MSVARSTLPPATELPITWTLDGEPASGTLSIDASALSSLKSAKRSGLRTVELHVRFRAHLPADEAKGAEIASAPTGTDCAPSPS